MEQFDPNRHGLYPRFLNADGSIVTGAWNAAAEAGQFIGSCRVCGAHCKARPTTTEGRVHWYSGYCTRKECGREFAAPNGGYLRRSGRWGHMPEGFWDHRTTAHTIKKEGR